MFVCLQDCHDVGRAVIDDFQYPIFYITLGALAKRKK